MPTVHRFQWTSNMMHTMHICRALICCIFPLQHWGKVKGMDTGFVVRAGEALKQAFLHAHHSWAAVCMHPNDRMTIVNFKKIVSFRYFCGCSVHVKTVQVCIITTHRNTIMHGSKLALTRTNRNLKSTDNSVQCRNVDALGSQLTTQTYSYEM